MVADTVFVNAAGYAADAARTRPTAIAVQAGRIAAVGHGPDVAGLVGPSTRLVDLGGRTLCPAFQDAHVHPQSGGLARSRCALYDLIEPEDYLRRIAAYRAEHPERDWIRGDGWSLDSFGTAGPRREPLDQIAPGTPVYLRNRDGHTAWVNTRALELAGVGAATADPPGGRIERGPDGEPTGALHEEAMMLVERLLPPITAAEWETALLAAQQDMHALGITAWNDASVREAPLRAYVALAGRDALTMRCQLSLLWEHGAGIEHLDTLIEQRAWGSVGRVQAGTAKFFQDGVLETHTGALLEPYAGSDETGESLFDPADLKRYAIACDAAGFQIHVHAIGDRAVRETLDALEAARRANGPRDSRHHIAHVELVHPHDLQRFAALDATANCQALWACDSAYVSELTVPFLGPERSARLYPFASLRRAGARLAFGSDWTVSTVDPLPQMEVATTRVYPETREVAPLLPDERLDLATCLDAFTIGAAYVNRIDDHTGSLEVGKAADLVVLDRDLFDRGAGHVSDARVLLTLVDGEAVYDAGGSGW